MAHIPKVANFGIHPVSAPGTMRPKSRTELLRQQRAPPTTQYTTSTVHPSHSRHDQREAAMTGMGGDESGAINTELQQQHEGVLPEQVVDALANPLPPGTQVTGGQQHRYDVAGGGDPATDYTNYVGNLQEQVSVLEAQVGMYKKGDKFAGVVKQATGGQFHQQPSSNRMNTATPVLQTMSKNNLLGSTAKRGFTGTAPAGSASRVVRSGVGSGLVTGATPGAASTRVGGASAVRGARGGRSTPMMEVHETNLMETLNKDAQASIQAAEEAKQALEAEKRQAGLLKQELHQARQVAAGERASAFAATKERDQALTDAKGYESQFNETQGQLETLHRRFDFAMEELNSVKQELDVARATSRMKRDGVMEPGDGTVPQSQLEAIKAQLLEAQDQVKSKDDRIQDLLECNERAVAEQTKYFNALRHEEQKIQMNAAETESAKCLLKEAEAETKLLRTENGSLKEEVERLSKRCDDLGHRFQTELDCQSLRDNRLNQSLDTNKVLQKEVMQLNNCYMAEKAINEELRAELESQQRLSDDLRRQLKNSQERYTEMQKNCSKVESHYRENMATFQHQLDSYQNQHNALVNKEAKQLGATMNLLKMMQQDIDCVAQEADVCGRGAAGAGKKQNTQHSIQEDVEEDLGEEELTEAHHRRSTSNPTPQTATTGVNVPHMTRRGSSPVDVVTTSTPGTYPIREGVRTPPLPSLPSTGGEDATMPPAPPLQDERPPSKMSKRSTSGGSQGIVPQLKDDEDPETATAIAEASAALAQDEQARSDAAAAVELAKKAMRTPSPAMTTPSAPPM